MIGFSAIRRLLDPCQSRHEIQVNASGVTDKAGGTEKFVAWGDVTRIYGMRVGKVTYDENFLVIESRTGSISLGELDGGFASAVHEIRTRFPDIPADWMAPLEEPGSADMVDLWPSEKR